MQNIDRIIQNHAGRDGFEFYSIDYGPSLVDRSNRKRFSDYAEAREFAASQLSAGNSIGVFYIYSEPVG